ncbi:hypothetical protein EV368DRAFT_78959 [Lentinula lateritia]|nr:hypothetical protein EV368DRAFT_78959 [Lentinula lateritia]
MKSTFDPQHDLTELRGKVIIVTGGNRSTGLATVKNLVRTGATVYMAAGNEGKALHAIAKLSHEGLQTGNGKVKWLKLDLSDPREAKIATKRLWRRKTGRTRSFDHGCSQLLKPLRLHSHSNPIVDFEINSDVRMIYPGVEFSEIEDLNVQYRGKIMLGFMPHSKLLDILWPRSLQKHFNAASPSVPIVAMSIHPGQGSYTSVFAVAVKDERGNYCGAYLDDKPVERIAVPSATARDDKLADGL